MKSFFQSKAAEAKNSDFKNSDFKNTDFKNSKFRNFGSRTAALAIGTIGAVMMSLVMASAATTFRDHRDEGSGVGAAARKGPGKCKSVPAPPAHLT